MDGVVRAVLLHQAWFGRQGFQLRKVGGGIEAYDAPAGGTPARLDHDGQAMAVGERADGGLVGGIREAGGRYARAGDDLVHGQFVAEPGEFSRRLADTAEAVADDGCGVEVTLVEGEEPGGRAEAGAQFGHRAPDRRGVVGGGDDQGGRGVGGYGVQGGAGGASIALASARSASVGSLWRASWRSRSETPGVAVPRGMLP
ncbi:hypothetical protein [Streptomyces sp. NBRC 110028]|uniref:hypothetical protein n=1 Tax=Streptomyces sp. NBRC 110028 TaxID=1621260 RepID=UPI0006E4590A|nr:hypothetical protein [Streptomyces sp. NBRC 110028]